MSEIDDLYNQAEQLRDDGKPEEAISKLTTILEQDESHVLSHLALAVLYGRVNKHEDAIKHGKRACELEPGDRFNYISMSVTYQRAFEGTRNQEYIGLAEEAMAKSQQGG